MPAEIETGALESSILSRSFSDFNFSLSCAIRDHQHIGHAMDALQFGSPWFPRSSALRPNLNQMDPLNTSGMDFHSQIKEGHKTWGALSALMAKHGIVSPIFAGSELGPHVRQWSTVLPSADRPSILEALEHPASAMWGGRASHSTKKHRIKWNQYGGSQTFRSKMSYFFRERDLIKTIQKPSALPVGFLGL